METLRKIIFLVVLINLVKVSTCRDDDLFENFMSEERKQREEIERDLVEKTAQKYEAIAARNRRNFELGDVEYDEDSGGDDGGDENEKEENFEFSNLMRTYRDKFGLRGVVGGSAGGKSESTTDTPLKIQSSSTTSSPLEIASASNNANTSELANRVIETLDEMREELESMRMSKTCNETPDGSNCDINGTWNAAEIGLHIELSITSVDNKLLVTLAEKIPKKSSPYRIDASWKCSGAVAHTNGGPFYFHCARQQLTSEMAIFHGICKRCSGFDMIFGEWIFQHVPRDCRQLWTFSETRRDVFYKNALKKKSQQSEEGSSKANVNQTASSQIALKSTSGISNSKSKRNHQKANTRKWNSRDFY